LLQRNTLQVALKAEKEKTPSVKRKAGRKRFVGGGFIRFENGLELVARLIGRMSVHPEHGRLMAGPAF
jgi:hypothetical protein